MTAEELMRLAPDKPAVVHCAYGFNVGGAVAATLCERGVDGGTSAAACSRGTLAAVPARSAPQPRSEGSVHPQPELPTAWLLLIYTVPAQPSRKRATVWREIKKLGAVYLRDGVCVLPEQPETFSTLQRLADRIVEMDGEACVVKGGKLDGARADGLAAQFHAARADEYAEIDREADQLLAHIARETEHREFTYAELEELEQDLGKLRRWTDQVHARDYFGERAYSDTLALLERCDQALEIFLDRASAEADHSR